jgi:hypothetical protein
MAAQSFSQSAFSLKLGTCPQTYGSKMLKKKSLLARAEFFPKFEFVLLMRARSRIRREQAS